MDPVNNALGEPVCPVSFWCFAGAVIAGNLAAVGARALARAAFANESDATRTTAGTVTGLATFWLVGGLTWVFINRRPR